MRRVTINTTLYLIYRSFLFYIQVTPTCVCVRFKKPTKTYN